MKIATKSWSKSWQGDAHISLVRSSSFRCQADISYLEQSRQEWASASAQVTRYRQLAEDLAGQVEELEKELEGAGISTPMEESSKSDSISELEKALEAAVS